VTVRIPFRLNKAQIWTVCINSVVQLYNYTRFIKGVDWLGFNGTVSRIRPKTELQFKHAHTSLKLVTYILQIILIRYNSIQLLTVSHCIHIKIIHIITLYYKIYSA